VFHPKVPGRQIPQTFVSSLVSDKQSKTSHVLLMTLVIFILLLSKVFHSFLVYVKSLRELLWYFLGLWSIVCLFYQIMCWWDQRNSDALSRRNTKMSWLCWPCCRSYPLSWTLQRFDKSKLKLWCTWMFMEWLRKVSNPVDTTVHLRPNHVQKHKPLGLGFVIERNRQIRSLPELFYWY
jgi:hypothetical protein